MEKKTAKPKRTKQVAAKKEGDVKKPSAAHERLDAFGEANILSMIGDGVFYSDIAKQVGVSRGAMMNWLNDRADLYARAREARADKMAEDILEIADDSAHDKYTDGDGVERTDHEVVARARLRVDSRKWLAAKMFPKRYGDKVQVGGADDLPAIKQDVAVTMTAEEAYRKLLEVK